MEAHRSNSSAKAESNLAPDERIASLFQPDAVLSAQYFENLRRRTVLEPEQRLMLAVLEDGIHCYLENLDARTAKRSQIFKEAADWITAREWDWVFSFESVCDALGLNPEYVRQGLLRWRAKSESSGRDALSAKLAG
ncbi:MAG TPA: hypothetical protein VJQ55_03895 [Candidatus Binatia bacterium]|nr:hypothetical protein [Candidatus Binatia bacterium]